MLLLYVLLILRAFHKDAYLYKMIPLGMSRIIPLFFFTLKYGGSVTIASIELSGKSLRISKQSA
jgi:hypothetical protein